MVPVAASDPLPAGLNVRPVRPEDAPGVVRFLNQAFGAWGSLEHWRWKYQDPPAPFRLDSVLAEWEGRIVGHYGMLPLEATWGGRAVRAAQSVDGAVLPECRRRGVFTALAAQVLQRAVGSGVSLLYALPGLYSLDLDLRHGYRSVAFVPEVVRVLSLRRAFGLALGRLPGDLKTLWAMRRQATWTPAAVERIARLRRELLLLASWASGPHLAAREPAVPPRGGALSLRPVDRFDARFDALWADLHGSIGLGLCKHARYLNWRYGSRPSHSYTVIVAEEEGQLRGCVVMRLACLRSEIVDLLAAPGRGDVVAGLLAAAMARARSAGSVLLSAWAPAGHPHYPGLRRAGFVSSSRLHGLAERWPALARWFYQVIAYTAHLSAEQQAQLAGQAKAWPLAMGDSDLV